MNNLYIMTNENKKEKQSAPFAYIIYLIKSFKFCLILLSIYIACTSGSHNFCSQALLLSFLYSRSYIERKSRKPKTRNRFLFSRRSKKPKNNSDHRENEKTGCEVNSSLVCRIYKPHKRCAGKRSSECVIEAQALINTYGERDRDR